MGWVPGVQGDGERDTDYFGVWNTDYFDYICAII